MRHEHIIETPDELLHLCNSTRPQGDTMPYIPDASIHLQDGAVRGGMTLREGTGTYRLSGTFTVLDLIVEMGQRLGIKVVYDE